MNRKVRIAALFSAIFVIAICGRAIAQPYPPQVTFTLAPSSSHDESTSLTVTGPMQGDVISKSCDTCDVYVEFDASLSNFSLGAKSSGQYPCEPEMNGDTSRWKGDGQHIYVVIDKGKGRLVNNLNATNDLLVENPTPGPHVLTAYLSRSWDESLKAGANSARVTDLYTVRTFYIDTNTGTHAIDTTKPLIVPNSPLDTNNYKYPADSVLLDFYMMFKNFSDGYVLEATVYDSTMQALGRDTLTSWAPYCIGGLEQPPLGRLGKYYMQVRLLDSTGNPVSNGPGNLNNRIWPFWVRRS